MSLDELQGVQSICSCPRHNMMHAPNRPPFKLVLQHHFLESPKLLVESVAKLRTGSQQSEEMSPLNGRSTKNNRDHLQRNPQASNGIDHVTNSSYVMR